ncbi:MAG: hypothetical protein KatS3mg013_0051 [Actinomycetota bacterium]|nr:MAG: hypothetical protein KatS3mg013_0051 [Actinomycetota bacterium]
MAELRRRACAVIACYARPEALDLLEEASGCRVAPDEALVVVDEDAAGPARARIHRTLAGVDPDALVLDATDGWTAWSLEGADARVAFERLSDLPLPTSGAVAGAVLGIPARVLVTAGSILVLVTSAEAAWWERTARRRVPELEEELR